MKKFDKEKIKELEKLLKEFPQIKEIQNLKKRIKLETKKHVTKKPKSKKKTDGNLKRSSKMKRYHRYLRRIKDVYFPDMKYRDIQREFKNRKIRNESKIISDVVWQNPSP
jgi:hypothetical protein